MKREGDPSGFELAYDSGSSAKEIRVGVEVPDADADALEDVLLRLPVIALRASGMLSIEGAGLGVDVVGVEGLDLFFMADCRGGEGGRVEVVWRALVNSRDTEAVAFEVPEIGGLLGGLSNL